MNRLPRALGALVVLLSSLPFGLVQPAHAAATEWMEIRIVDGLMLVESKVAGIAGYSVIDTGAQLEGINGRFLEAEGLEFKKDRKLTVVGVHGKEERSSYRAIEAEVFGSPVRFTRLVDLDLGPPEFQLLLGSNFLESYIFQFDYTNSRMRLITRDSVDLKKIQNIETRLDSGSNSLLVRVGLDEKNEAWLQMDTGSNGGILVDRPLASRLGWIDTYEKVEGVSSGTVSSSEMEYFRIPLVTIGPYELENVLVSIPADGEDLELFERDTEIGTRIASRQASAGLVGYEILRHFVVTVDYDRGYVHFYPGEKISDE